MFESVLIANRGEIACRIIRTCRRLGIRTVAVYSAADAAALHVAEADESHCIGPGEAAQSYLRPEAIVAAARAHAAEAIHPGYGFLSERVELAKLCAANGIAWVGPSPRCIAAMGSKIEAKRLAAAHGVPSVPGYHGDDQSPENLLHQALEIGFPVLIKASAGGGGRGMRQVADAAQFPAALATARAEAMAAFGDDRMLLERFIARPRHIEVQLAGDRHGNIIHLFERECSIQRNYQKLVEEAPAPHLSPAVRASLFAAALRLGGAIGYDSLGTVEFILEAGGEQPYFLEMNTRLQVEHTVTEMITGLDLVEMQLRIAGGEPLGLVQSDVVEHGSAIELRLNAEDPAAGFSPQLGRVLAYRAPSAPGLRVDSGIRAGSEVTPFYDSLLLKLIAHGPDRAAALRRLDGGLQQLAIFGVGTNQGFLRDIIRAPGFADMLTTRFLTEHFPAGWAAPPPPEGVLAAAAVAMARHSRNATERAAPGAWGTLAGFRTGQRAGLPACCRMQFGAPGQAPEIIDVIAAPEGLRAVRAGAVLAAVEPELFVDGNVVWLTHDGLTWALELRPLVQALGSKPPHAGADGPDIVATMPGLISQILVTPGDVVRKGDVVVVQEAMKLMTSLPASIDGTVSAVHCHAGQIVAGGALLVEISPQAPPA
jgi:acetyl/propionyl-CoA carboxylase alpha subunit